jgi:hypothetical protein
LGRTPGVLIVALSCACGSSLRVVPAGPHPPAAADPMIVEYPPPPAKPEQVSSDPGEPCRWMDGHWAWAGRRWHWIPGAWVVPPADCLYARPVLAWYSPPGRDRAAPPSARGNAADSMRPAPTAAVPGTDSRLYYTEPKWHPTAKGKTCREPAACPTRTSPEAER